MAKKNDVIILGDDGLAEIERSILAEIYGRADADKLIEAVNADDTELEEDLQELADEAPAAEEF